MTSSFSQRSQRLLAAEIYVELGPSPVPANCFSRY
jgi:hypothetical protein